MRDNVFIMNIKSILSIAAFSTAFIFSTFFAGLFVDKSELQLDSVVPPVVVVSSKPTSCFGHRKTSATVEKIYNLLQQDDRNGRERNEKFHNVSQSFAPPFSNGFLSASAQFTSEYADESGSIRYESLPPEFQTAWRAHMKAWRDYADFLEKMKSSAVRQKLGEESFNDFEREYNDDINSTWYKVLRVAGDYGADVDEYYRN